MGFVVHGPPETAQPSPGTPNPPPDLHDGLPDLPQPVSLLFVVHGGHRSARANTDLSLRRRRKSPWILQVEATWSPLPSWGTATGRRDPSTSRAWWLPVALLLLVPCAWAHGEPLLQMDGELGWPLGGRQVRSYQHLEGDVRWRQLYSFNHFFLQIGGDGRVSGTRQKDSSNSIMEIRSVQVGTVVIRAIHSGFFLAMNRKGKIYGTKEYGLSCEFQERIEENGYNTYASSHWHHRGQPMFLSINGRGIPRWGARTSRRHLSTHFLPVLVSSGGRVRRAPSV
ncbi:hypothetical protein JRQ81_008825 [Phrynocephalus forsythii]|uniref:Fibroblast growth factor n=1 Tax=Phrynocephalus forsythii TaxID=171643 RepID=A0A9Q0XCP0_9SAUR|nr:hypothetical protein JRQ81_008825 [Phrynocephalus forsythii]